MYSLFHFIVDDHKFTLTRETLIKHQDSLFTKVALHTEHCDRAYVENCIGCCNIYVDADLDSFREIITFMRGYPLNINRLDSVLKSKLRYDAEYFKLNDIIDQFEQVSESSEDNTEKQLFDTSSSLSDSDNDENTSDDENEQIGGERVTTERAVDNIVNLFSQLKEHADSETADTSQMEELINTIQEKLNTTDSNVIAAMSNDPIVIQAIKKYQEGIMKDDSDSDIDIDFDLLTTDQEQEKPKTTVNLIDLLSKTNRRKN